MNDPDPEKVAICVVFIVFLIIGAILDILVFKHHEGPADQVWRWFWNLDENKRVWFCVLLLIFIVIIPGYVVEHNKRLADQVFGCFCNLVYIVIWIVGGVGMLFVFIKLVKFIWERV